jgi:hypothetical protein
MGTTWVLHTETKGTGAQMVPLEKAKQRSASVEPVFVPRESGRPRESQPPKPKAPRRFRVVDVMTRERLVDEVGIREALEALQGVRSIVDVNVYLFEEERRRWRPLTFEEQYALMELAAQGAASL